MRSWSDFCDDAMQLISYRYEWPDELSYDIQQALIAFDQLCLERLVNLLKIPLFDDEKKTRLRLFFAMRWAVVANTGLDYTLNPLLPTNQLFLRIAKQIAESAEAVCLILMPTIEKIIGSDEPENIKYASEDINGQFYFHDFLMSAKEDVLLSLKDIFHYAVQNTDFLFQPIRSADLDEKKQPLFDLSAADYDRIRLVSAEARRLFDALQENHRIRYQEKPSVGYELKKLQLALLKSSKIKTGSETVANVDECERPIQHFYRLWRALPEDTRIQIGRCRINNAVNTLEDYLLCLFAYTSGIELSAAEFGRVNFAIVPCTHMISLEMDCLLKHFVELQNIPIPGCVAPFSQPHEIRRDVLLQYHQHYLATLTNPRIMLAKMNARLNERCHIFDLLTRKNLDPFYFTDCIKSININKMRHFMEVLKILPKEKWPDFFTALDVVNDYHYFDFVTLLRELNTREWIRFFELIFDTNLGDLLKAEQVAKILNEIPEGSHSIFLQSINRYVDSIFTNANDVFFLLALTGIHNWRKVVEYFHDQIDGILSVQKEFIKLFVSIRPHDWLSFSAVFQDYFRHYLANPVFVNIIYDEFCKTNHDKWAFTSVILNDLDWVTEHSYLLVKMLSCTDVREWEQIIDRFKPEHFAKMISDVKSIYLFLRQFDEDVRSVVIFQIRFYLSKIVVDTSGLLFLIREFPVCKAAFISVFCGQLPRIFSDYFQFFSGVSQNARLIISSIKRDFLFLMRETLPFLLSRKMITEQCRSFAIYHDDYPGTTAEPVFRLYRQLRAIEGKMVSQEMSRESASIEKLKLLSEFMRFTKAKRETGISFYRELLAFYGDGFFENMLKNCNGLLQVDGITLFAGMKSAQGRQLLHSAYFLQENAQVTHRSVSVPTRTTGNTFFIQGIQMTLQSRNNLQF